LDDIFTNAEQIKKKDIDLIIVSVKAYDTHTSINQIKTIIGENTLILLAQNGYGNYEIATSILGKEKVILSRVIFGAKIIEIGTAEVIVFADDIVIGQPDRVIPEEILNEIAKIFNESEFPTRVSQDVYAIL
jgi:2-dehydropantoate 2-reductase